MQIRWKRMLVLASLLAPYSGEAAEPNETFSTATVLPPGVLSVVDALTAENPYPDTFLGIRSASGSIELTNDDDSIFGDGFASGLRNVEITDSEIRLAVTGFGDENFSGDHSESGRFDTFVEVFDAAGQPLESVSEIRTLSPATVEEFFFANPSWAGGRYNVNINNELDANDVDFWTFTGLSPGAGFTARTLLVGESAVDTMLAWFADGGTLLDVDDDNGGGTLSLISGMVPASGMLTFGVTGFGDPGIEGFHGETGAYELRILLSGTFLPGDYSDNGIVDAADYTIWRDTEGQSGADLAADGNADGHIDPFDFEIWKNHFGNQATETFVDAGSAVAVPECGGIALFIAGAAGFIVRRNRKRRRISSHLACSSQGSSSPTLGET